MSATETPTGTRRGFGLSSRDARVIGGASLLLAINIAVMYALATTPLAALNDVLFSFPIVGAIAYGAAIMAGQLVAERGVAGGNTGIAVLGMVILQLAFGVFGAGALRFVPRESQLTVLTVTAVVVAVLTALIAAYVYARSSDFDHWGSYANYAFIGGLVAIAVGTFYTPALLAGFALIFLGFLLQLGWEIWNVRDQRTASVTLQTIGVYIAVAGVFVHVLQLVLRYVASRG
ncbi:hypothetical protein C488_04152 [Natrinema pellirubrum DSM 15624]|uniref:Uncharacterized protein n=1 Tax=Natrinema pellirubrum (strain DSM 15624 / CIP 106293 / JCM 10476 / NCIMB 786 / 157) TaxID=797303 RepID=L0JJE2_NATP1|nr:hypothetical protein [Natrinema pellirubrum]AGB30461.1 hypothetical protein Natpe_0532 [Natrinema pellirubrum DSM 15624]ELY79771.1 hypothetical protein C488_04152 [Natrinema pellirubrum DSM 15624]